MITIRKADERGLSKIDWLTSRHSFSFADYYDAQQMGFASLRVINEDWVAAGAGFPTHPHRDMEIITYVVDGAVAHRDSMGNGSTITPGDVQRMSAGTGVTHSEYNPSRAAPLHLLQIWIEPDKRGYAPGYEQVRFADADKRGRMRLVASPDGAEGSVTIHQDARVYASVIEPRRPVKMALAAGRRAYVQVVRGAVTVNGVAMAAGDGARVTGEAALEFAASSESEVLLFDVV
ncbi:MAG TPA: pirin family protein [Candidatus Binataceae bacterium]|nr:pirin family protein [Candidatus Binataceae bacterium]